MDEFEREEILNTSNKKEVMRLVEQLVTNACMWGEHGTKDYFIQIEGIKKDIEEILNKYEEVK